MNLLWWVIPGVLARMPMPFIHPERQLNQGGELMEYDDDLPVLAGEGILAVVSLLNLPGDSLIYESVGFDFLCLPIPDGGAPTFEQAKSFVRFVGVCRVSRKPVAVHCEAGIGRTGTMLAAYLISEGATADSAIGRVRSAELAAIETTAQIRFLQSFQR